MKTVNDAVIDRLNILMGKRDYSQYRLACVSRVPYPTVKSIMQKRTKGIELKTVIKLARALNVSVGEFFTDELFLYDDLDLDLE